MRSFFVSGCFHWIGYHIVNHLLEHSYPVATDERPLTDNEEHLAMMIGRNDLFSPLSDDRSANNDTHVILSKENGAPIQNMDAVKTFKLSRKQEQGRKGIIVVQLPLLFGEWMPMNEDGVYVDERFIPFTSEIFQNKAVYIKDFIASFMLCLESSHMPKKLAIKPKTEMTSEKENDRQVIYLRKRKPIDDQIKTVVAHYRRFKQFYMI